jgi:hypothetical protein
LMLITFLYHIWYIPLRVSTTSSKMLSSKSIESTGSEGLSPCRCFSYKFFLTMKGAHYGRKQQRVYVR